MNHQVEEISVGALHDSPTNPRRAYHGINELAKSIEHTNGVVTPLLVRPRKRKAGWEIVSGHRRKRAAQQAKLPTVRCIVEDIDDETVIQTQLVDHEQRENPHPLDDGYAYLLWMTKASYTVAEIAGRISKPESHVYDRLKLLDLDKAWQKSFAADEISMTAALLIARLEPPLQEKILKALRDKPTGSDIRGWIEQNVATTLDRTPFELSDADLVGKTGPCTTCPKRTGASLTLFEDLKRESHNREALKDRCLDPKCFRGKIEAHIDRALRERPELIQISSTWTKPTKAKKGDPKWLYKSEYEEIETKSDRCAHRTHGIHTDPNQHSMWNLGHIIELCAEPACKKHRGVISDSSKTWRRTERERKAKVALSRETHSRAVDLILPAIPSQAQAKPADLNVLMLTLFNRMQHDDKKRLFARRGWEMPKGVKAPLPSVVFEEKRSKLSAAEQWKLLFEVALVQQIDPGSYEPKASAELTTWAKHFKVDLIKMRRTVVREHRQKAKKKPAKKAAKKSTKKAAKKPVKKAAKKPKPAKKKKTAAHFKVIGEK